MPNTLRGIALVTHGLLISTQLAFAGPSAPGPTVSLPEPGTLALMAAGVGALAFARFWKRK